MLSGQKSQQLMIDMVKKFISGIPNTHYGMGFSIALPGREQILAPHPPSFR